jgi:5-methylcytosine-specific restriction enzyme subunit McrC
MSIYDQQKDFFEFLVSLFLDDLEKALIAQLHREYISYDDEIPFLRGKINLTKEIVKPPTKKHHFFCVYDEFSADNQFNRIIKASLKRIKELCKYEDNRKRADKLYVMMDEVNDSIITLQSFSKIGITRLNENYREIIQFCKLILFGETVSSDSGTENFYAFFLI